MDRTGKKKVQRKMKACKKCRLIVEKQVNVCPICKESDFTESFRGRIIIFSKESEIAKKLKIEKEGEYAIRTK